MVGKRGVWVDMECPYARFVRQSGSRFCCAHLRNIPSWHHTSIRDTAALLDMPPNGVRQAAVRQYLNYIKNQNLLLQARIVFYVKSEDV